MVSVTGSRWSRRGIIAKGSLRSTTKVEVCHKLGLETTVRRTPDGLLLILLITFVYSFIAIKNHTKDSKNKDPGEIIIDEFIGQAIPIYLYEISHGTEKAIDQAIIIYAICFLLFRFFDIKKPFPVSYFDKKQKNSFGVVMDDVCAGFYVVLSLICFMMFKSYI